MLILTYDRVSYKYHFIASFRFGFMRGSNRDWNL